MSGRLGLELRRGEIMNEHSFENIELELPLIYLWRYNNHFIHEFRARKRNLYYTFIFGSPHIVTDEMTREWA